MTKQMLSDFVVQLKAKEHEGNEAQLHVIRHYLTLLPPTLHWRVYLDVADLSKRESHFRRARCFYERAIVLQPREPKAWLEYAKMEEEHGHLSRAERILRDALFFCPFEENLIIVCYLTQHIITLALILNIQPYMYIHSHTFRYLLLTLHNTEMHEDPRKTWQRSQRASFVRNISTPRGVEQFLEDNC
jgi:tetratricopeptide (TPR) repeat protein